MTVIFSATHGRLTMGVLSASLLCIVVALVSCDGYHTNSKIYTERLIQVEGEMVAFCEYILAEEDRMHEGVDVHEFGNITAFLDEARGTNEGMSRDPDVISEHPVALYRLRKRIADGWPSVLDQIAATELITNIPVIGTTLTKFRRIVAHEADADNALDDLLQLQHLYRLRTRHLVGGHVGDWSPASGRLDDDEMFAVGRSLLEMERPVEALEWLDAGLRTCRHAEHAQQRKHYANVIANTHMRLNRYEEAKEMYEKLLQADPSSRTTLSSLQMATRKMNERVAEVDDDDTVTREEDEDDAQKEFWAPYCRGEIVGHKTKPKNDPPLYCYSTYINSSDEYIRTEELLVKPRLVLIHDLLADRDIDLMVRQANKQLWKHIFKYEDSYFDMEASTVLEGDNPWTEGLASRLHNVTFQNVNVTDEIISWIQVENTGPGVSGKGIISQKDNLVKDRGKIGHFLIFLNDVRHGGSIIFPEIEFSVQPKKGAALFWQFNGYNDPGRYLLHRYLQCPVLLGTQWIAKAVADYTYVLGEINL